MAEYLQIIISIIFLFYYQVKLCSCRFNLHYTEDESLLTNMFDHSCLHTYPNDFNDVRIIFTPYCIRLETKEQLKDEDRLCYGEKMTFKELKSTNVNAINLFDWNADIELIDLYEKYLLLPNLINENETYCKCASLSQLGRFCQYKFNNIDPFEDEQNFNDLMENARVKTRPIEEMKIEHFPCYVGIPCENNLRCLDWRQICNGIVDCDTGEDELLDLCLQLEVHKCDSETEFRCKNGFCITQPFSTGSQIGCLDRSDANIIHERDMIRQSCSLHDAFDCEEYNSAWKKFPCGDDQSIFYSDLTSRVVEQVKKCRNKRDFIYLKQLFSSKTESQCWKSMMCLTGFNYLYSNIICSSQMIETNIKQYCPNEFHFPENSVIYSFVFFLYENINRTHWFNYTGPDYICYNKKFCNNNISIFPTILKNNLTCIHINQPMFSWKDFHDYTSYLFHKCFLNFQTSSMINDKMLYKCNLTDTFISVYRVKDTTKDCFFHEDENSNIDICLLNSNDHFKCLTNQNECIQSLLVADFQYDCSDRSDEYITRANANKRAAFSRSIRKKKLNFLQIYHFEELCDGIINHYLVFNNANETDETDCQYWTYGCSSPYTNCNDQWNCKNGRDELNCASSSVTSDLQKFFNCTKSEHYCIQFTKNYNDIKLTCLHINRTGDGIIDCLGGTDEHLTNICTEKYPFDTQKRFYCMNSSICIRPDQVCNRIIDCPFEDDERVCPWLFKSNSSNFYCQNSPSRSVKRCTGALANKQICPLAEHMWFCDLASNILRARTTTPNFLDEFPKRILNRRSTSLLHDRTINDIWLCNQGYPIQSSSLTNKLHCLCPPTYYGNYCQYQSERLTIIINIELRYDVNPLRVFRLIFYLLNENNSIISHDEVIYNYKLHEVKPFIVYLMYDRLKNISLYQRSKSRYVRIDSYIIKETNIQYISSWLFNIRFPFLPVNRLKHVLFLENELFKISNCKKKCGSHGKCMYYINSKEKQYCWCEQGWFGDKCHLKSSSNLCNKTSCAPYSQCIILNDKNKQSKCICPLGKSGRQCYIKYNSCFNVLCQNNGTCLPLDQRNFEYTCVCPDGYKGEHCEESIQYWSISISANISSVTVIPAIIVISCTVQEYSLVQSRMIHKDISLPIVLGKDHRTARFAFIQVFHNISKHFYYMILIQRRSPFPINTTVISQNLCKNVSELFNATILLGYSYLKRLKLYHIPCNNDTNLRCFFDEYRMCFCTINHKSDCYFFDHDYSNCDYCRNNGVCIRRDRYEVKWTFVCLCPKCTFGNLCEFSTGNYFITLDMLIGIEVKTGNILFTEQSFLIHLALTIFVIMFVISLISNLVSVRVFSNKKLRQVGCDLYLLNLTIVSQMSVVLLFLRFIHMIINQIYIIENTLFATISCKILEYSVRLMPTLYDWLTVCISIERAYTVIKDVHFTKIIAEKTLKMSRWIISSILLFNILTTLHRPFYLTLVDKPTLNGDKEGHPRCVLDFKSTSWNTYEKFINVFHLAMPIILNVISILVFISYRAKFEFTATVRKRQSNRFLVIKQQFFKYKSLIISTLIIIILEIPRFIIAFTLACIEHNWQRYMYLTGYLISLLPFTSTLFIYIIPSPKYKKQYQTVVKKLFRIQL